MAAILFVTWRGGGNLPPALALEAELVSRGHETRWLTLPPAPLDLSAVAPPERIAVVVREVFANPAHIDAVRAELAEHPADVLVVDCLLFGALAAGELDGLRTVCLVHTVPGGLGGPEPGLAAAPLLAEALKALHGGAGLPVRTDPWDVWTSHHPVVTAIPELDLPYAAAIAQFDWVGPLVARPTNPRAELGDDIVVSVSTYLSFRDLEQAKAQRLLDAVDGIGHTVHLTAPTLDVSQLRVPPNVRVRGFVDHAELMGSAALVVTHGGHGTVSAALVHGVPLVCVPNPAADQPFLSARVAEAGCGLAMEYASPAEDIRRAITEVLAEPRFAEAALELQKLILATPGASGAADRVEAALR